MFLYALRPSPSFSVKYSRSGGGEESVLFASNPSLKDPSGLRPQKVDGRKWRVEPEIYFPLSTVLLSVWRSHTGRRLQEV